MTLGTPSVVNAELIAARNDSDSNAGLTPAAGSGVRSCEGRLAVLVACEFSAVVRDAFRAAGHDAWSCDLLPTEGDPRWHWQEDCRVTVKRRQWDLLIHHTPCTYATNAGARWLYVGGRGQIRDPRRWQQMEDGAALFREMQDADVPMIAGENPIPHRYAIELMGWYTQIIQPHEHGHGETKATCLWLKNLPKLEPTNPVAGREPRVHHASPGPNRWMERSRTLPGIAAAMVRFWGNAALRKAA